MDKLYKKWMCNIHQRMTKKTRPKVPKGKWYRCIGLVSENEEVENKDDVVEKILEILQEYYGEKVVVDG